MKQKTKKIISVSINVLLSVTLAALILTLIFAVVVKAKGDKSKTWFFGLGFYQIISGSMQPELDVGDLVIAKSVDFSELEVGDNIVFIYNDKVVTHKIVEVKEGEVITHGIANSDGANETISKDNIIAKQVGVMKGVGKVLDFMRSPFGFVLIILIPIGAIIVSQTITLTKRLKEYRQGDDEGNKEDILSEIERLKAKLDKIDEKEDNETDKTQSAQSTDKTQDDNIEP